MTSDKFRWGCFGDAWNGLRWMFGTQPNARFHLFATLGTIVAASLLSFSWTEWCILLLTIAMVWTAEAINTAIECVADAVHPDHHPLIGKAKDISSGAVLVTAIAATVIGIILFGPRIFAIVDK